MTRVSEVIRGWLGWCPDRHILNVRSSGIDEGMDSRPGNLLAKNPGPGGTGRPGIPNGRNYEHTQRGTLIIGSVSAAIILILASMFLLGIVWVAVAVTAILVFALAICSTLTVSADDDTLRIRFGPVGLIRKSWPIAEIASVTTVTNPWYYGWGIRWTPSGPLYNVSGYGAVEVRLISGKVFRIGTDEPEVLKTAIETARGASRHPPRGAGNP
jgi:hypothetical protein